MTAAAGTVYRGRLQLARPQWVDNPNDVHATITLTARQIVDAVESHLLWTDQAVQRGVKPELDGDAPQELSLADGYPAADSYVFDGERADDMVEKLLAGEQPRLDPLIWNLRPGEFEAYFDEESDELYLYSGKLYLPDSHHRHQAIVRAFQAWDEVPEDYPWYHPERQYTIELYFMTRDEEGEYFYQKNVLGRTPDKSKSYDLTLKDPASLLARRVIDFSKSLKGNVNRVTDRLSARNRQVVTLSTLRSMVETIVGESAFTPEEVDAHAKRIAAVYDALATVRPELGQLDLPARLQAREKSMAAQAVMMHGYAEIIRRFVTDIGEDEKLDDAVARWTPTLARIAPTEKYKSGKFEGDFLARDNPLWTKLGLLQRTKNGRMTVSNVRQSRANAGKALIDRLGL